ncbi:hypothetical protein C5U40_03285 [Listeria monocytogenes]|nr:hypothetical protein [Listeria monocytogenes]RJA51394.1 hypothetical protein D3C24_06435 [Listeria monocytogenes]
MKGISYLVYTKDLTYSTMLVIEGEKRVGCSEYLYTFYKVYYEHKQQHAKYLKVYIENESALKVIKKVEGYLNYIDYLKRINSREGHII